MIRHKNILPNKRKGSRDVFGNDVQSDLCVIVQEDECVNKVISDEEEYEQSEDGNQKKVSPRFTAKVIVSIWEIEMVFNEGRGASECRR